ncbi:MAG: cbb3-type cytochrome c oxidase subunit I [Deltaproteobacteria bacterium]|nr:cbb3-type cytochrome c oxidase subunit I [Deltaproteobacteria bacterium]
MSSPTQFRTCGVTGLKVDRNAENLLKINAVVAVVMFTIGVVAALMIVLTRWQAVHLLPADWYYRLLTAHGLNMLIFFIIFFEMAILYFAGPILLNARLPAPKVGWLAFGLMVAGAGLVEWMVFAGRADVTFTSYPPLRADPLYYLGIILFAVGALVVVMLFFATLVVAKREKTYQGSVPLVTFGAIAAAIIAVITLLHGAMVFIPTLLWSMGLIPMDAEFYRLVFWGLGHSSQQINVAAMVAIWYFLAAMTMGGVVLNEKISRIAFVFYVLFISMASAHHLLVDPGFSPAWKVWNTSYFMYMAVLASMIHGFTVPAGMELGMRLRGFNKGRFEWLTRAPWGDPGFSGMILSLFIFGFLGGITGVAIGTEQINIIAHNTMRIPGHFHATVVGGTALAFMAVTYYVIPLIFRKEVALWPLAKIQPYLFGGGITIMSVGMILQGFFGVPRRHWDISGADSPFPASYPPVVDVLQAVMALGGVIAFLGGLIFVLVAVLSVFFGKPLTDQAVKNGTAKVPQGVLRLPPQAHDEAKALKAHEEGTPGTVILVTVFFLCFVLYYLTNWQTLSKLWQVG